MTFKFHYGVNPSNKAYATTAEVTITSGGIDFPDPSVEGYVFKSWCPIDPVKSLAVTVGSSTQEGALAKKEPAGYEDLIIDDSPAPAITWEGTVDSAPMTVYIYTYNGKNCASKDGESVEADATGKFVWGTGVSQITITPTKYNLTSDSEDIIDFYAYYEEIDEGGDDSSSEEDSSSDNDYDESSAFPPLSASEDTECDTLEELRDAVGIIPTPFATDPSATTWFADDESDSTDVSFSQGFPDSFIKPVTRSDGSIDDTARVISRGLVNTIGNIGTQEQFFSQCGGYYTFDQEVCNAIGGYPESAILRYFDEASNTIRTVYSLKDGNDWNFLTKGVDGVNWKYVDDNPSLSLVVDYSEFIDLSSTLFVETGIADFYEVPYDSWLNLYSFSFCIMSSTKHVPSEDVKALRRITIDEITGNSVYHYDKINAGQFTNLTGTTYLDIYNVKTNTTRSIMLREEGSMTYGASAWTDNVADAGMRYFYKQPRYVVGQGTCFLNKGDQIRVRGVYVDKIRPDDEKSVGYEKWHLPEANISAVHEMTLTDAEVQRYYLCRFANLYKVGWRA